MAVRPQRTSRGPSICNKTTHVLSCLCLFDGLRTPSIRRLMRRANTVCQLPILLFDPRCYAPSIEQTLTKLYRRAINCPYTAVIDPSLGVVQDLIQERAEATRTNQRLLIHYYGHGCHPPRGDALFFFSEDRSCYKPTKLCNLMRGYQWPICFLFDCANAGSLLHSMRKDTLAFFACSEGEELPSSTDIPLDLFSSCLLKPYETAVWWHARRYGSVFSADLPSLDGEEMEAMHSFHMALLDGICIDSQDLKDYEAWKQDPSMHSLLKGFALAQRIMESFNVHAQTYPQLRPMGSNPLWDIWDMAIDIATSSISNPDMKLWELCMNAFSDGNMSPGGIPVYAYFLMTEKFQEKTAEKFLEVIDENDRLLNVAIRIGFQAQILKMLTKAPALLVILAKTMVWSDGPVTLQPPVGSMDVRVLRALLMNICIVLSKSKVSTFNRLTALCMEHCTLCAPFANMLLGLILKDRSLPQDYMQSCIEQLSDPNPGNQAATLFVLGASGETSIVEHLKSRLQDPFWFVREQALWALYTIYERRHRSIDISAIVVLESDSDPRVRNSCAAISSAMKRPSCEHRENKPMILTRLIDSVHKRGFRKRYWGYVFDDMPNPE